MIENSRQSLHRTTKSRGYSSLGAGRRDSPETQTETRDTAYGRSDEMYLLGQELSPNQVG